MTMISEQPLMVSLMLGLIGAALLFGWLQTGKRLPGIAGVVLLLLIPVAWIAASLLVTDREQIETILFEVAAAVEAGEYEKTYQYIGDPDAEQQARQELPLYTFKSAKINSIRGIDIIDGSSPTEADVDLTVKADVSNKSGSIRDLRVVRRLILRMQKNTGGVWKVVQYQHLPMLGGPDQFSNNVVH
ncbi:hypothetical protein [Novipirellula artificiosorum]|uniref:Uncharacterized protein n=1 Tax=Novipirellula artificiosorum TaxID=2528016 RepID=A0A5C6E1W0_9BACT|nr:hypothetical protein [Novipirellula artificiosorum]TWU42880.1 hypothetical protein Poly41_11810 [Novipirellula artificiosorum]